jgi:hypothetical protein
MPYNPTRAVAAVLDRALAEVNAVPYAVTARWVFYRLLQAGILDKKGDYKRLLSYLSKARKQWYGGWRPDTLTDDSRAALVNGGGYRDGQRWARVLAEESRCVLDRWPSQDVYVEIWFEAAAMTAQFEYYADPNISLLAFHGDISIPAKWDAALRLVERWRQMRTPIQVMYYGDLDPKGMQIPESAERDVRQMMVDALFQGGSLLTSGEREVEWTAMLDNFTFERIGLNDEQIDQYGIQENPERPGTYQWEGVPDDAAQELIGLANEVVDTERFDVISHREDSVTAQFRTYMEDFTIDDEGDENDPER